MNAAVLSAVAGSRLNNSGSDELLRLSVITAARNEEKNIADLIESIESVNYPTDMFELIIVDDGSDDNTFAAAENILTGKRNFRIIKAENKQLPAKRGALSIGISEAKHPFIVITDADCRPEKNWLAYYNEMFKEKYDFVFGAAPFFKAENFAGRISCFENFRNALLAFSSAKLGIPYTAAARNFGFRKDAYQKVNGYTNTTDTLSGDDDLLLREAVKHKMKIGAAIRKGAFVYSAAAGSLREYFIRRSRHTKTSFHYLLKSRILLTVWHSVNLLFLFSPVLFFINPVFVSLFFIKMMTDIIVTSAAQDKIGYRFNLPEKIYLQFFYEIFLIINFFGAVFQKERWK